MLINMLIFEKLRLSLKLWKSSQSQMLGNCFVGVVVVDIDGNSGVCPCSVRLAPTTHVC